MTSRPVEKTFLESGSPEVSEEMETVSPPPSLCLEGLLCVTAGRWQKVEHGDRASPDRLLALHTRGSRLACPPLTRVPDSGEDAKEKMRSADP